jgi:hypothetical protein
MSQSESVPTLITVSREHVEKAENGYSFGVTVFAPVGSASVWRMFRIRPELGEDMQSSSERVAIAWGTKHDIEVIRRGLLSHIRSALRSSRNHGGNSLLVWS